MTIPPPLPWEKRKPSMNSSPRGYSSYIHSLREICDRVVSDHPTPTDLVGWIQGHFVLSESTAKVLVDFLHRAGVLESAADRIHLSEYANHWYAEKDDAILVGLLHSRIQFVGEMLAELRGQPRSIEELRQAAQQYNLEWEGPGQVNRRRGWLESAGLIEPANEGRLALTDAGRDLLSKLTLQPRSSEPAPLQPPPAPRPPPPPSPAPRPLLRPPRRPR